MSDSGNSGSGCAKFFGYGCLGIFLLFVVGASMFSGGGAGSFIAVAVIVAIVIIGIRASRKEAKREALDEAFGSNGRPKEAQVNSAPAVDNYGYSSGGKPTLAPMDYTKLPDSKPSAGSVLGSGAKALANPVCDHTFTRTEVMASAYVTCACKNTFASADLLEYERLIGILDSTEAKLTALETKMSKLASNEPVATSAAVTTPESRVVHSERIITPTQPEVEFVPAPRVASAKVKPVKEKAPKVKRPKIQISLSQWLIIGAAVLVLVAGSIFVGIFMQYWNSWEFLAFTVILASAATFGAFKTRAFSVLLSNFLAAFSSAMQFAAASIIFDLANQGRNGYKWSNMPAWAWAACLLGVGLVAVLLARKSRNFGWKAIAMFTITATTVMLEIGVIALVPSQWSVIHLATASIFATGLLAVNRIIRKIPNPEPTNPEFAEYEAALSKSADNGLFQFGRFAAGLQIVVAVGMMLLQATSLFSQPFAWGATLILAAVWAGLSATTDFWAGQLTTDGSAKSLLAKAAPAVVYISLAATVVELTNGLQGGMLWLNIVLTLLGLGVLIFAADRLKWFKPGLNQLTATTLAGAVLWVLWNNGFGLIGSNPGALAGFLIGVGLVLNLQDYFFKSNRFLWAGGVFNGVAMLLYFTNIRGHVFETYGATDSVAFGALVILLIVLGHLQIPVRRVIRGATGTADRDPNAWIAFGTSVALVLATLPSFIMGGSTLAFTLVAYPVIGMTLGAWGPFKNQTRILNAHAYLGHVGPLVWLIISGGFDNGNGIAPMLGILAVANYGVGAIKRQTVRLQIGFAAAFGAVGYLFMSTRVDFVVQVLAIAVLSLMHTWILGKRSNLTAMATAVAAIVVVPVSLYFASDAIADSTMWTPVIELSVLTALSVVVTRFFGERLFRGGQLAVTVMLFSYALFVGGLAIFQSPDGVTLRLLAAIVIAAAIRLYKRGFTGLTENILFYVANLWVAVELGFLTHLYFQSFDGPEQFSFWIAVSIVVSTLLSGRALGNRQILLIDVPVLGFVAVSMFAALANLGSGQQLVRGVLSLVVISAYSYWRSKSAQAVAWLSIGYLSGGGAMLWLASGIITPMHAERLSAEVTGTALAISALVGNYFLKKRVTTDTSELRGVLLAGTLALPSLFAALGSGLSPIENLWRAIGATLVLAAFAFWRTAKTGKMAWIGTAYVLAVFEAFLVNALLGQTIARSYYGPEIVSALIVAAILATHTVALRHLTVNKTALLWDIPIAIVSLPSLVAGLLHGDNDTADLVRVLGALVAITALSQFRARRTPMIGWLFGSYIAAVCVALELGHILALGIAKAFQGPEFYSVLVTSAVVATNLLVLKKSRAVGNLVNWDLPVAVLTLPSLVYGLLENQADVAAQVRIVLVLLIVTALAYLRTRQSGLVGWVAAAYVASIGEAVALGHLISVNVFKPFDGPEIYSLLAGVAVFATHSVALKKLELKNTLLSWGLPTAVLLIPSILATYTSLALPFDQLSGLQIARMIVTLAASIVLLVLGIRLGNLANATMGLIGLALVALPNVAMHTSATTKGSQVETTSLLLGILVFLGLWIFGKFGSLRGNSRLFIGVPVVIFMAPTLVRSFIALSSPELTTIDWWRFSIILAASMTLLIVGSLRELAGMFYPGLASLLLSALPYGFKQSQSTSWLLWVMLLLVAGVMIWLAVRLERLKKAGRTSAAWLKELK